MQTTRRTVIAAAAGLAAAQAQPTVTKYVRYRNGTAVEYGILEGELIREIKGDLFGDRKPSGRKRKLSEVKLLYPCVPPKVLAVGLNYKSHLGTRTPPTSPEMFYKPITCLQNPGDDIAIPKDSKNTHYEGELVLVIGKRASRISVGDAPGVILGVTCGNDVSERDWQNGPQKDLQWWRAKGADTFGPLGPAIVTGLDYGKLLLQTRLNGDVVQKQVTSDLLFGPAQIVSYISHYVTLNPGDVIYTGTPGSTKKLSPGDVVEVDIEGIGILRNKVVAG
ncbi:MAG TPA: fumarylacetoacetate hydrolase family protein [Bryobacteraceae bacterium]|jgi:2-keto-4-pentenoate hydratase/2-oxohepta-3-ene-1,7-dioic acid hydratase in catechol pathway|nr:fumarylacetoacetate hydrolase family protein [Bryobacteraceae bacterium]